MRRFPFLAAVVLLATGCALLFPTQSERDKTLLAVARECQERVHGTQVRGIDSYSRVTYQYRWEAERMAFEECYFDGAKTRGVAGPLERPIGASVRSGGG